MTEVDSAGTGALRAPAVLPSPGEGDVAVRLVGISHSFGARDVFHEVDLDVRAGESVSITGRSGSGKTTLLSCILGLIDPLGGEVYLAGTRLRGLSRHHRAQLRAAHVGVVFQRGELVGHLTAAENVALPALMSAHRRGALERATALLAEFEVPQDAMARDLSGGEIQRTALARALINEPRIMLADEPTGALDTELRERSADRLFGLVRQRGCALVVVSHDPALADRADRAYRLEDGTLRDVPR